jgi:hypothetical protein
MDHDWAKGIARRLAAGEHVPSIEKEEFEEHIRRQRQWSEDFDRKRAEEEGQRAARLKSLHLPREVVSTALDINKTASFDVETFQAWLAEIADSTGPTETPQSFYKDERAALLQMQAALAQLEAGFDALAASHGRRPIALYELRNSYNVQIARLIRGLERHPSLRGKYKMSLEMGMIAWDWGSQVHLLGQAIQRRLLKVSRDRKRGQPRSDYWKHTAAFEVAFALYRARWHAGSNQPIPNGRDGSERAVAYLLDQLLNRLLGENLASATIDKFAAKGIATLRKLVEAEFDDSAMPDPHDYIVSESRAPVYTWAKDRGFRWAADNIIRSLPHELVNDERSSTERWADRAAALRSAFLERIGLWLFGSRSWKDD